MRWGNTKLRVNLGFSYNRVLTKTRAVQVILVKSRVAVGLNLSYHKSISLSLSFLEVITRFLLPYINPPFIPIFFLSSLNFTRYIRIRYTYIFFSIFNPTLRFSSTFLRFFFILRLEQGFLLRILPQSLNPLRFFITFSIWVQEIRYNLFAVRSLRIRKDIKRDNGCTNFRCLLLDGLLSHQL